MYFRVFNIILIIFTLKSNLVNTTDEYYTETGLRREGSGDGIKEKLDFKTYLKLQSELSVGDEEDDEYESGSGSPDAHCDKMLDIAFILDASGSIGPVGFRSIKTYTKQILNELDLSDCDNVGIVRFTDFANSETYLGSMDTKEHIFARIDDLEEPEKLTESEVNYSRIAVALLVAEEIVFTKQLGSRPSSKKFLVIMTDGKQPKHGVSNRTLTVEKMVKKLNKKGIRILVVAVGNNPSIEELLKLTTDERNVFPERRVNDLINIMVPKDNHPNAVNQMGTDLYVTDDFTTEDENNHDSAS